MNRRAKLLTIALAFALAVVLVAVVVILPHTLSRSSVKIAPQAPYGSGVIFIWTAFEPPTTWVAIRRIRLLPAPRLAIDVLRRSVSNSLPPVTLVDDDARLGDCFLAYSGIVERPPGQRPREITTRVEFVGCITG